MFGPSKAERAHIAFLQRQLAVLDAALKPRPPVDFNAEQRRLCLSKTTSLTVTFGRCECDQF